jgi:hypothetical protein
MVMVEMIYPMVQVVEMVGMFPLYCNMQPVLLQIEVVVGEVVLNVIPMIIHIKLVVVAVVGEFKYDTPLTMIDFLVSQEVLIILNQMVLGYMILKVVVLLQYKY